MSNYKLYRAFDLGVAYKRRKIAKLTVASSPCTAAIFEFNFPYVCLATCCI